MLRYNNSRKSFHSFILTKRIIVYLFFILKVIEFKHGNIASMLGICTDADTPCVIWEYCSKGSVQVRLLFLLTVFIFRIFDIPINTAIKANNECEKLSWDEMP